MEKLSNLDMTSLLGWLYLLVGPTPHPSRWHLVAKELSAAFKAFGPRLLSCFALLGLWCQLPSPSLLCRYNWSSLALGLSMCHSWAWLCGHGLWWQGCALRVGSVLTLSLLQSASSQGLGRPSWALLLLTMTYNDLGGIRTVYDSVPLRKRKSHSLFWERKFNTRNWLHSIGQVEK